MGLYLPIASLHLQYILQEEKYNNVIKLTITKQLPNKHLTPASWECVQEVSSANSEVQFINTLSLPVHVTLVSHIIPVPCPKLAPIRDCDPVNIVNTKSTNKGNLQRL